METPGYFIGGVGRPAAGEFLLGKRISDQKAGENFTIDDLLDFSNDDMVMSNGFLDNVTANSTDSSTGAAVDSCKSSFSGCGENHFPSSSENFGHLSFVGDSQFSGEFCVPYEELAELEWLSNFDDDFFSTDQNLQNNFNILSGPKPPTPEPSSSSARNPINPVFSPETHLLGKARSKRSRVDQCDWSTRLLHLSPKMPPPKKRENLNSDSSGRKCLHCAAEKTPQWRTGPMGPKTLCNACGVRYKSGRLVPEYRPAASPTFASTKHSNSHRKVLELRRQQEFQRARQQQFLSQSSIFGVSNGGDKFLINHHGGPEFRHMI